MARISHYPSIAHLRSDAASGVILYRNGEVVRSGRGLAFWFRPLNAAIAEVPLDDRELPFLFRGRSADLQEVVAQGVITYRVTDPVAVAARIDFGIDLRTGLHSRTPLDQIATRLTGLAQQHAWAVIAGTSLRELVADGVERLRERIEGGLRADADLPEMGLAVASVRVTEVAPSAEVEKALAAPVRERIAGQADEAAFARRAAAVDKERAIAENELANRIELAKREELLVTQQGSNERRRAEEEAAAARITAEGSAETRRISSTVEAEARRIAAAAEAEAIRVVDGERNASERDRIEVYRDLAPAVLMGLAAREFAGKIRAIEHLNVGPDMLGSLLGDLLGAGARHLEAGTERTGESTKEA
jgi:regulator of protease activity HflC (stomatin/prohibitin superfamily)